MKYKNEGGFITATVFVLLIVLLVFAGAFILFRNQIPYFNQLSVSNLTNNSNTASKKTGLDELRIGLVAGLSYSVANQFYPFYSPDFTGHYILTQYLETLVTIDGNLQIQPLLAQRWANTDDKTWIFYLQPNVKYSNGDSFDANDVKFTIDTLKKYGDQWDNGSNSRYLDTVKEVKIINPLEVQITTNEVDRSLLNNLARVHILSHLSFNPQNKDKAPIGTGPYILTDAKADQYAVLTRNENYWGTKPLVKKVTFQVIEDDDQRVNALLNHQIDLAEYIPGSRINELKQNPDFKVVTQLAQYITFLGFDVNRDKTPYVDTPQNPFKDIRVRKAIYEAIDMNEVNKSSAFNGMAETQSEIVNTNVIGYNPNIKRLPYNLDDAKKLMTEAGYPNGFKITVDVQHPRIGDYISDAVNQLKKINIDATIKIRREGYTSAADRVKFNNGDSSMFGKVWDFEDNEALNTLSALLHTKTANGNFGSDNTGGYSNPEVDKLTEEALAETNEATRISEIQQAIKLASDDIAFIPLNSDLIGFAYSKNIYWQPRLDQELRANEFAGLTQ
ncbi:ABC transporter substrate-binding protein [Patescibacteria group bacterium]|nr:ABC transporter substrate-binding protein [Patescibacteria group bacterium]